MNILKITMSLIYDYIKEVFMTSCRSIVLIFISFLILYFPTQSYANDLNSSRRLINHALKYYKQKKYKSAEYIGAKIFAQLDNKTNLNTPEIIELMSALASVYFYRENYDKSEYIYKKLFNIAMQYDGIYSKRLPDILDALATIDLRYDRYSNAVFKFKKSIAIQEANHKSSNLRKSASYKALSDVYQSMGLYDDAASLLSKSLDIREKDLGPNNIIVADTLSQLSDVMINLARYQEAETYERKALTIREKLLSPNNADIALSLYGLGKINFGNTKYSDAEKYYKKALSIQDRVLDKYDSALGNTLDGLADAYIYESRFVEAEKLFKRALKISEHNSNNSHNFDGNKNSISSTFNNLAAMYQFQGRYAEAEALYKRCLKILEQTLGADNFELANPLNNLGTLNHYLGRYSEAIPLFTRSISLREKYLGNNHPVYGSSIYNLSQTYFYQGKYIEAEQLLLKSLEIFKNTLSRDHDYLVGSQNALVMLYIYQNKYLDAYQIIKQLIENQRAARWPSLYAIFASDYYKLIPKQAAINDSLNVYQSSSSSKASLAFTMLTQRFITSKKDISNYIRTQQDLYLEKKLLEQRFIDDLALSDNNGVKHKSQMLRNRLTLVESEIDKITSILDKSFPDYLSLTKPLPLSIKEMQSFIGIDESILVISPEIYYTYIWIISKNDSYWTQLPVTASQLNDQVDKLRSSLNFNSDTDLPFDSSLSFKIYKELLYPIEDKLSKTNKLSIVTHGALTSLPFGLLIRKDPSSKLLKNMDWLIKTQAISTLPSIYSLKLRGAKLDIIKSTKSMIAFADPVFSRKSQLSNNRSIRSMSSYMHGNQFDLDSLRDALPQLPNTLDEVQTIAKVLKADQNDIIVGYSATETAVKLSPLDQYSIIYFATHGLVSGDLQQFNLHKIEPSLVLSFPKSPNQFDDGLLEAGEVTQLKLNADWVVLSACNTASAEGVGAEPLSGLAKAFIYAGAKSLLVSHWEVSDDSTKSLMTYLFEIIAAHNNITHGEALQQAMIKLINEAKSDEDAHPKYWAPFVVVGEPPNGLVH